MTGLVRESGADAPPLRFGRFELLPRERRLMIDGVPALIGPRAYDMLLALVERRGRLVSKDELFDAVWPGLVVEENNLQKQVSALRKVLVAALRLVGYADAVYAARNKLREVNERRAVERAEQLARAALAASLPRRVVRFRGGQPKVESRRPSPAIATRR